MTSLTSARATDDLLLAVADRRRRIVLQTLAESGAREVPVERLVATVAEHLGTDGGYDGLREEVAIQLRHAHLPKLDDLELIDYDRQRRTVRYTADEVLESLLTFVGDRLPTAP